uniref:Ras GTPase-activating-like protein IQGAP2 n=1 Tax=Cacopsylla melanoneura TaxID=428564 RepID=A0A8D8Z3U4_9HEMI
MSTMIPTAITTNSLKRINKDEDIDDIRQRNIAYEYLCHLEEAKIWIESCVKETLPPCTELEANLRNGVVLAKLGHYLHPDLVPDSKIYDVDQSVYKKSGLRFRHTDNINYFIKSVVATQLPRVSTSLFLSFSPSLPLSLSLPPCLSISPSLSLSFPLTFCPSRRFPLIFCPFSCLHRDIDNGQQHVFQSFSD